VRNVELHLSELSRFPVVAPDVESTGKYWYRDKMFGIAIAAYDPKAEIMAANYWDIRDNPKILDHLRRELPKCKKVVNHALKFDLHMLANEDIWVPPDRVECTMVRAALINENEGHSGRDGFDLDSLAKKYLDRQKVDIYAKLAELFGGKPTRKAQIGNLHRAPVSMAREYAIVDPELALLLWAWQEEEIRAQGIERIWDLERRLMPLLVKIERQGVRVDEERAQLAIKDTAIAIREAQAALDQLAGKPVNAQSAPQLRVLFGCRNEGSESDPKWFTAEGTSLELTDAGGPCLDKDALIRLEEFGDPRAKHIRTLRRMDKARQFLSDHIIGHAVNGRVFPNYNQTRGENELGTGTGRFSIDDPALQQIPARDKEVAAIVRACFLPETGDRWACADWEQFEFRWFAHYTKDPNILQAYEENPHTDFHQTVSEITGIPRNPRYAGDANAKQINLGLVFGMGRGEMAYQMGLEHTVHQDKAGRVWKRAGPQAERIFDSYHSAIPGVKALLDQAASRAKAKGYVQTVLGRRIRFPGGRATHKAAGLVFQGTSADCMKLKMLEMDAVCEAHGWRMLLSVHDEIDFSVPTKQEKKAKTIIQQNLETFDGEACPIKCRVPIRSSVAFGPNWWEASK
jgi:DNA polymerase I-like protein with 3'-5' exonuclease and polymerase domains